MAKRRRMVSLDSLVAELSELDARRKTVINQLSAAIRSLAGGGAGPAERARRSRSTDTSTPTRKRRRRRKMSAAARKKISEAQKKRWAKANAAR
jgi:hypothetical protein